MREGGTAEEARSAHEGPRGAGGGDEVSDRSLGVPPDLRACALKVGQGVIGIVKLIQNDANQGYW